MAQANETILLDVKISNAQAVQNIAALKEQVAKLKQEQQAYIDAQNDEDKAAAKNSETYVRLNEQVKALNVQISEQSRIVQAEAKEARNLEGSYNALSAQLAQLKSQYKAVATDEEREEILVHLKEVNDRLVELDEQQGVYVRNVGNYPKAITAIIPGFEKLTGVLNNVGVSIEDFGTNAKSAFKAAGQGMANLGKQAMSLLANPIIAAIAAVLVVLQQLYEAFQRSEAAQNAWQKSIAPFKAMWQNFQRIFDDLVKLIMKVGDAFGANGKILEYYMRNILLPFNIIIGALRVALLGIKQEFTVLTRVFKTAFDAIKQAVQASPLAPWFDKINKTVANAKQSFIDFGKKVREVMDEIENSKIGQFLGLEEYEKGMREIIGANSELIESNKRIAESEANIARQRRENITKDANDTRDIAELRAKAAQKDKYNQQERIQFLEEANAKEEAIAQRAYELAKAKYEAEKLRNSLTESNAEDLEREAQAYADMVATETAYFNKQKELAGQISELRNREAEEAKKRRAEREKAEQEAAKAAADALAAERELILQRTRTEYENEIADLEAKRDKEIAVAGLNADELLAIEDHYAAAIKAVRDREQKDLEEAEKAKQAELDAAAEEAKKKAEEAAQEREDLLKTHGVIAPDDGELQKELDRLQAALDAGLISEEEYGDAVANIYQKIAQEKAASVVDMAQQALGAMNTIMGAVEENENAQMEQYMADNEAKKEALKDRLDSGLITQAEYDNQVANLDKEQEKKKKELDLKQAKRQKAMAIMNATLNAAGAIIASLAQSPVAIGPIPNPVGIASLALATTTGIAQIAAAAATPLPKASRGMLISGPSHAQGGTLIEAEGGEAIINKKATSRFLPILSRINQSTGGIPLYGSGGIVGDAQIEKAAASQQAADAMANTPIYVTVVDINEGQERMAKVVERKSY